MRHDPTWREKLRAARRAALAEGGGVNETITIPADREAELGRLAADLGWTRRAVIEQLLDIALASGAGEARVKLGVRKARACAAQIKLADIRRCASDGLGVEASAKILGVSKATISRRLSQFGILPAGRTYSAPRASQVLSAVRNGSITAPAIADRLGCSRNVVTGTLLRLENRGGVIRGATTVAAGNGGRPAVQWRLPEAAQ